MIKYIFYLACFGLLACSNSETKTDNNTLDDDILIHSSNPELVNAFNWAKDKARSFIQTGKVGPINISEQSNKGDDSATVAYIPSYWAGYPLRTAYYSRDFCHQVSGAHLLGLRNENFSMLKTFAGSADEGKKWFPLWAINFDGSTYTLDYHNNDDFVREIPAVFELVDKTYLLYLWTGDTNYYQDEVLWNFCTKAVTDFIQLHDQKMPNGVPEGSGGGIFEGTATYNEQHDLPLLEAGDDIASEYKAFTSYSKLAELRGNHEFAMQFAKKADELKDYFNQEWGVTSTDVYNRGYSMEQKAVDGWGKENSWFMPMKGITDAASARNLKYLDFIEEKLENKEDMPVNIEAISYIPELFFQYHQNDRGWKWMQHIISEINSEHAASNLTGTNGNYPEVSFVLISNVIEGLMGVSPDAGVNKITSFSHLPGDIEQLSASNIRFGDARIELEHQQSHFSRLKYLDGERPLRWKACFAGNHTSLEVNGIATVCQQAIDDHGQPYSFIVLELSCGEEMKVKTTD